MSPQETIELLKVIKGAYGKFEIHPQTPEVWHTFLESEKLEEVVKRLQKHTRSSRFEPTISDLLPSKEEKEKIARDREIALNNWVNEGNDPRDYRPND